MYTQISQKHTSPTISVDLFISVPKLFLSSIIHQSRVISWQNTRSLQLRCLNSDTFRHIAVFPHIAIVDRRREQIVHLAVSGLRLHLSETISRHLGALLQLGLSRCLRHLSLVLDLGELA